MGVNASFEYSWENMEENGWQNYTLDMEQWVAQNQQIF